MTQEDQMTAILESLQFIQENMMTKEEGATKEDLRDLESRMATKEDLVQSKSEVLEHIDGFARQNQKFDQELVAAQAKFNRIEERVEVLELKAGVTA